MKVFYLIQGKFALGSQNIFQSDDGIGMWGWWNAQGVNIFLNLMMELACGVGGMHIVSS